MFDQSLQAFGSGHLLMDYFIRPDLFESLLEAGAWQCEYVVYHAE
jgi:hypothetical protein